MRGEDRLHRQLGDGGGEHLRAGGRGDLAHRLGQPAVPGRPVAQPADAVHLLGGVGQVEVGGERTDQLGRRRQREVGEQPAELAAGGLPVGLVVELLGGLAQRPDLLDEIQQLVAVLAHQSLAEQRTHPADVGAQVLIGRLMGAGRIERGGDGGRVGTDLRRRSGGEVRAGTSVGRGCGTVDGHRTSFPPSRYEGISDGGRAARGAGSGRCRV